MKRIIKDRYFGKIQDIECKDYLLLVNNDYEVQEIKDYFKSKIIDQYDSFFIDIEDGEYQEIYGYFGEIPDLKKEIYEILVYWK